MTPLKRALRFNFLATALAFVAAFAQTADGYALNGKTWVSGTVTFQIGLGTPLFGLSDGSASWNDAVGPAFTTWNQQIGRIQLNGVNAGTLLFASSSDRVNSVLFANDVFGSSFGTGTLAVTYYTMQGSNMIEADVLFNRAQNFDSYRGKLRFGSNGYATGDIRRVLVHELGHGIGLNHQSGDNIMAPTTSDRETLSDDDIAGAQAMYGAPAPTPVPTPASTPVPTPTPTPVPTATPTPTPGSGPARVVNISTRMKVGTGDNVLIAGFIIQGTQPKKLILRAIGPSLTALGVSGALQDPMLEIHDATGNLIAQNDDWQNSLQSAEISASGVAPTQARESAIIATLSPGTYTAILTGRNSTQGVALVEAYELTAPTTRLANISTRGSVGTGEDVMIGGLIVQGSTSKRVVVRAVGPSLAALGVSGTLSDPALELYDGAGNLVASNDNWFTSTQASQISAAGLAPGNQFESAVLANLAPGNYTATVRGANNTRGVALVEVYDIDP